MSTQIADALVSDFEAEIPNTQRLLEAVPEDKLGWKPHEKSMTLGELASHVAESPCFAQMMMEPELVIDAAGDRKPFRATNHKELMAAFEKNAKGFGDTMKNCDDGHMSATWTMRMGDTVVWSAPRHAAMRVMMVNHIVHHRGQLTVYLRLLDVPVPATYGPSADFPM